MAAHPDLIPFNDKFGMNFGDIAPMARDDQDSVEQNNDFSDYSQNRTMETPPKNLQTKPCFVPGFRPLQLNTDVNMVTLDRPYRPPVIPDHLKVTVEEKEKPVPIANTLPHVKLQSAIDTPKVAFDGCHYLKWTLFLISLEYAMILGAQLACNYALKSFVKEQSYWIGVGLLIAFVITGGLMMLFCEYKNALFLKCTESVIYGALVSWALAYLDFSFLALSYMVVLACLITFIFVC